MILLLLWANTGLYCPNSQSCEAKKSLKSLPKTRYINGVEYGSHICRNIPATKIKYIQDNRGNMTAVCMFPDKSYVELGTLESKMK